jgi:hypothetical protein
MKLVCLLLLCLPLQAVKFFADVLPAMGAGTTVAVNASTLWHAVKATPRVVKALPKGPKAMKAAAKTKK